MQRVIVDYDFAVPVERSFAYLAEHENLADVFGANLARHRHKAGLSQEELADRASLHRTEISPLETGIRLARIDTVVKLAGALGVHPGDLFDGLVWEVAEPVTGRFRDGGGTR